MRWMELSSQLQNYIKMERMEIESMAQMQAENGELLIQKFSINSIIAALDRNLLQSIENIYRIKEDGLDIIEFTRFFMNCIEHEERQGIFLVSALSQFFQVVAKGNTKIKFSHITDFVCQRILQAQNEENELTTKWIPIKGHDISNLTYLKKPPVIKGGKYEEIGKVWVGQSVYDKGKHDNIINEAYFSQTKSRIYCLESLADWIGVYTPEAKLESKIRPSSFKVKKDAAVLSIAFSERQERLGAILKDFSISFWDASDNFTFQKSIPTAKYCQQLQSAIWYLQYFQKWVTGDMVGVIYIWDLPQERPEKIMRCKNRARINDLCEIPSINALAVVQEQRAAHVESTKIQLLSLSRGEILTQIDTKNDRRMLHTLRYSEEYQILLSAGFEKRISLFEINTVFLDTSLKGELLGHESAITCFTLIKKSPMVVSADDKGKVKVWNIRNYKCMQTIDFTDKVVITKLLDLSTENKIAALGSRITLLHLQKPAEETAQIAPLKVKQSNDSFYVFTPNDIRLFDFKDGKMLKINCHYNNQETDTTTIIISNNGEVITGNEKGQVNIYNSTTGKLLQSQNCHSGAIQYLEEDLVNNLLISASDHTGFIVFRFRKSAWEELRLLKGNFIGKQLSSIVFSSYHSFIGFISGPFVFLVDYEQLKIIAQFTFERQYPTNMCIVNGLGLILISTSKGSIHVFETQRGEVSYLMEIKVCNKSVAHVLADLKCRQIDSNFIIQSNIIYCSDQSGGIRQIDFTETAKNVPFKNSKANNVCYNPYRQARENFDMQLKKGKFFIIEIEKIKQGIFQGNITTLAGHNGGINSLDIGQFDEHLLISTGSDNRVKVWQNGRLIGDVNINRPLPYLWDVNLSENKKFARKVLQGVELIQAIFKRFGKDISIAQSKVFKIIANDCQANQGKTTRKSKKNPTLLQDQFNVIDLNYDKIKRQRLLPINGPSLKRMQISKNVQCLQKEWSTIKEKQEEERDKLLKSIRMKAYKNEEKDVVVTMLRDRNSYQHQDRNQQSSPALKIFQEKLQGSIRNQMKNDSVVHSSMTKINRDQTNIRFSSKKFKTPRCFEPRMTFQSYFTEKFSAPNIGGVTPKGISTPDTIERERSRNQNQRKQNSFRQMLKQMREKLNKSKKQYLFNDTSSTPAKSHIRHESAFYLGEAHQIQHLDFCEPNPLK